MKPMFDHPMGQRLPIITLQMGDAEAAVAWVVHSQRIADLNRQQLWTSPGMVLQTVSLTGVPLR